METLTFYRHQILIEKLLGLRLLFHFFLRTKLATCEFASLSETRELQGKEELELFPFF